jgi:hypothetical protein
MFTSALNRTSGHDMVQAVSFQLPKTETRVSRKASSCGICGMQNNTETNFVPRRSISPVSITPSMQQTHSSTNAAI